jgi:hypothetical protein
MKRPNGYSVGLSLTDAGSEFLGGAVDPYGPTG